MLDTEKCLGRQCDWWQTCEDCCPENAIEVTEFTFYDPAAVDKACIDMMNQAPGLSNSAAEESGAMAPGDKKLDMIKGRSVEPRF